MNRTSISSALLGLLLLCSGQVALAQHHAHQHGKVDFPISCRAEAQSTFSTGLALLHHMMYEQAEKEFRAAAQADPGCAMAYWGIAMAQIHPLWGPSTEQELEKGLAAVQQARSVSAPSAREQAYIEAAARFLEGGTSFSERLAAWEAGQKQVFEAHPDDLEAGAFYALALLGTAPKEDKTFAQQKKAGALLEKLHARAPEHPGLFHYTIHAYDNPVLAERGLQVARGYDQLAPEVPHALHMPSHIFVRLGLWPDVVSWNLRSADAARRQPVGTMTSMHYAHALDYLAYAYLQQGQDDLAREVVEALLAVDNSQPVLAAAYALAATPARYALERARWSEAAVLAERTPASFPWDEFPGAESILYFARGLGAAKVGDAAAARSAVEKLDALHAQLVSRGEGYWAIHADAQRKAVAAWLALSEGDPDRALALMRAAADLEDSVDKSPVTPSAVLPARELLGDLLLELERPAEAIQAYEAALIVSPNRFNSLAGAGRAAELVGDREAARRYYGKVVELASQAEAERPGLTQARAFLARR